MDWQEVWNSLRKYSLWILTIFMILAPFFSSSVEMISGSFKITALKRNTPTISEKNGKSNSKINQYFHEASREFHVPVEILMAIAFVETRWQDQNGGSRQENGYGIMHLADNENNHSLKTAAEILGIPEDELKYDVRQNIRGAAAVLAQLAEQHNNGILPAKTENWFTATASYSGNEDPQLAKWYADEVFRLINVGAEEMVEGQELIIKPTQVVPNRGKYEQMEPKLDFSALS
ncbi:MAG: transglycosylase SLT domain-containing protein [Bacillaceae bacterium]|nr:transglycosylase SLT domain-containing protein [Bacillaceae bacterium]